MTRPPILAAWGAGVNSTAMLIELIVTGQSPDAVLFADTGGERPQTYAYIKIFRAWLHDRGVPLHVVQNNTKTFKNWPNYHTLEESCITNATLPSKVFGYGSCSVKFKIAPQNAWTEKWEPAKQAWASRLKVLKLIGYDTSPQDVRRYVLQDGNEDPKYDYRYPLRILGWDREACVRRIEDEGLPVPIKSACFFCPVTKPQELATFEPELLRRIVAMEARAKPQLRNIDGLWRKPVKGMRGATPRPGSMTEYIRDRGLLTPGEIDDIILNIPRFISQPDSEKGPDADEAEKARWIATLNAFKSAAFQVPGTPAAYRCGT